MGRYSRVTLADIARHAQVDPSTVSLVLNRKELAKRLMPETRERIFAVAKRLNYQPSHIARALSTGKTGAFGMVVGALRDPSYSMLAFHMITAAQARGYQVLTCPTSWDTDKELGLLRMLYERNVDGIFYLPNSLHKDPAFYEMLRRQKFPVVKYCAHDLNFASVGIDYLSGFKQAAASLSRRHRKIGHICPHHCELEPLRDACRFAGIELVEHGFDNIGLPDCASEVAEFVRTSGITAFVVSGSVTAIRLMSRLTRLGIRVPDDIELVGVGNFEINEWVQPELSCISYDIAALMEKAVDMLINYTPRQNFLVSSEYVIRQSTLS